MAITRISLDDLYGTLDKGVPDLSSNDQTRISLNELYAGLNDAPVRKASFIDSVGRSVDFSKASFTPTQAQPFNPDTTSLADNAVTSAARGWDQLMGTGYGLMGLMAEGLAKVTPSETYAQMLRRTSDWGLQGYLEKMDSAGNKPAVIGSYENIRIDDGVGSFVTDVAHYAVEAVAENIPMFLPSMVTGGVGAAVARKGAEKLVQKMVADGVAKGLTKEVAEKAASKFVAKQVAKGAAVGGYLSASSTNAGEFYGGIYKDTGVRAPGTAALAGFFAGLLEIAPEAMVLKNMFGPLAKEATGHLVKRLGVEGTKTFLAEGGTEALQTIVEKMAVKSVDSSKNVFSEQNVVEIIDSALKGGLAGGIMGAGGEVVGTVTRPDTIIEDIPPPPTGKREQATQEAPDLTEADRASPIPDDLIQEGKAVMKDGEATQSVNELLTGAGVPKVNSPVTVQVGDQSGSGVIVDAYKNGQDGSGVKIAMEDGSTFVAPFDKIASQDVLISLELPVNPAKQPEAAPLDQVQAMPEGPITAPDPVLTEPVSVPEQGLVSRDLTLQEQPIVLRETNQEPQVQFDPQSRYGSAVKYAQTKGKKLNPLQLGKAMGLGGQDARTVLDMLASRGVIRKTDKGTYRQIPVRKGPTDILTFIADRGGIRDDEGHDLKVGRGGQKFIPGAEKITDKKRAERNMDGPKKASVTQKGAGSDGGLFDTGARDQGDIFDVPKSKPDQKISMDEFLKKLNLTKYRSKPAAKAPDGHAYRIKKDGDSWIALRMGPEDMSGELPTYMRAPEGETWSLQQALDHVEGIIGEPARATNPVVEHKTETVSDKKQTIKPVRKGDFYEITDNVDDIAKILGVVVTENNGVRQVSVPAHSAKEYYADLEKYGFDVERDGREGVTVREEEEAKRAPDMPEKGAYTIAAHDKIQERIFTGDIIADELKAEFKRFIASKESVMAELKKLTKKQLEPMVVFHSANERKDHMMKSAFDNMAMAFSMGDGISYSMNETMIDAVTRNVEKVTDEEIQAQAIKIAERRKEFKQTYDDPQTIEQFDEFKRVKGYDAFSTEQKIRYDELFAERGRDRGQHVKKRASMIRSVDIGDVGLELVETRHSQKGYDLFVVKMTDRVEKDVYKDLVSKAKRLGGWYSRYNKGDAIPGFQFKDKDAAESFMSLKEGDVSNLDRVEEHEANIKGNAVERLRAMAESLDAKADDSLGAYRKTNTAKRAREAGYIESRARGEKALVVTMKNLADAIESGKVKNLDGIRTKTHIELLNSELNSAKYNWVREQIKKDPKLNSMKFTDTPVSEEMVAHAKFPYPRSHAENIKNLAKIGMELSGAKKISKQFLKASEELIAKRKYNMVFANSGWRDDLIKLIGIIDHAGKLDYTGEMLKASIQKYNRAISMGLNDLPSLRAAMREFLKYRGTKAKADPIVAMERDLVGNKSLGVDFFPTPPAVLERIMDEADIRHGMRVLEPSAGKGDIADAAKNAGAEVDTVELSFTLQDILKAKGHNVIDTDFETFEGREGMYDRVVMNPPFSNRLDAEHVRKAYNMLKPEGRLVAIMGEGVFFGSDQKAVAFRDWLEEVGGTSEQLPEGSFKSSFRRTSVATRLVVIDKGREMFSVHGDRPQDISAGPDGRTNLFEEDIANWQGVMDTIREGKAPARDFGRLGATGFVLQRMGFKPRDLVMSLGKIYKTINNRKRDGDPLPETFWNDLPELLADPEMVLPQHDGGVIVVTGRRTEKGNPIVVPIAREGHDGASRISNVVLTSFGKDTKDDLTGDEWIQEKLKTSIQYGEDVYIQKGLAPKEIKHIRTQLGERSLQGRKSIIYNRDDVIKEFGRVHYRATSELNWNPSVDQEELTQKIKAIHKRIAPNSTKINVVDELFGNVPGRGRVKVAGVHRGAYNLTEVAINYGNAEQTVRHEGIHALKNSGLFTTTEWNLLSSKAKRDWIGRYNIERLYPGLSKEMKIEEAIAQAFAEYESGGEFSPTFRRILEKIREFLKRLKNALNDMGFHTVESIFDNVEVGEVGNRDNMTNMSDTYAYSMQGKPTRTPWGDSFPEVQTHIRYEEFIKHPEYRAAKDGNTDAAYRLVKDVLSDEAVESIRKTIGDTNPIVASVHAEEASGRNKIPMMYAEVLAERLGLKVDDDLLQTFKANHGGASAYHRMAIQPTFGGTVEKGRNYIILDDTVAMGGTIASLKGYIEEQGGHVIMASTLSSRGENRKLNIGLTPTTLGRLRHKHPKLDDWWKKEFGYGIDSLTEGEAGHLRSAPSLDAIGDRLTEARQAVGATEGPSPDRGGSGGERKPSPGGIDAKSDKETSSGSGNGAVSDSGNKYSLLDNMEKERKEYFPIHDRVKGTASEEAAISAIMDVEQKVSFIEQTRNIISETKKAIIDRTVQGVLDQFDSIKKYEMKTKGDVGPAHTSAYKMARLSQNLHSAMASVLRYGPLKYEEGEFTVDDSFDGGFESIFEPLAEAGTLHLWKGWAMANRAQRLMKEGRENNMSQAQITTLLLLEKKYPEFRTVLKKYQKFNKAMLDMAENSGLINADQREIWEKDDYVPFHRIMEGDASGGRGSKRSGIRTLVGGKEKTQDIIENMVLNMTHLVDASFKNVATQRVVSMLEEGGMTDVMTREKHDWTVAHIAPQEAAKKLEEMGVNVGAMSKEQKDQYLKLFTMRPPQDQDVISVMIDGKPAYYRVHDPLLLSSIVSLGSEKVDTIMRALGAPKRWLTTSITTFPGFMVANYIRDSLHSWVATGKDFKPFIDSAKGFAQSLNEGTSLQAIMAAGGGSGGFYRTDPKDVRNLMDAKLKGVSKNRVIDAPGALWRVWQKIGQASENANRIAIYEATLKETGSKAEAAFQAMDVMDFAMRGDAKLVQFLIQTVPFLNARAQGLYRLARGVKQNPKTFLLRGSLIMAASLALTAVNWDDKRYDDLPEWDKDMNYHIFLDNLFPAAVLESAGINVGEWHIRIPKPFEVGAIFSTIPERVIRYISNKDDLKTLANRGSAMLRNTFAVDMPQFVKPIVEQLANKNFFLGTPIVPMRLERLRPAEQYDSRTSEFSKAVGSVIDSSPKRLDALIRGYFGNLGMYALAATDAAFRSVETSGEKPAMRLDQIPELGRFFSEHPARSTKFVTEFYDMRREVETTVNSIRHLYKTGRKQEGDALLNSSKNKLLPRKILSNTAKMLSLINNKRREIEGDKIMSSGTKRVLLNALLVKRNKLVKRAVELTKQFEN